MPQVFGVGLIRDMSIKSKLQNMLKAVLFKVVYPLVYRLSCVQKLKKDEMLFCEVRHGFLTDSYIPLVREAKRRGIKCHAFYIHNNKGGRTYLWRYLRLCTILPRYGTIFVDDTCNLFGAFKPRKGTKIVQTWHSCGAFKKWGYSIAGLSFGQEPEELDRYPAHNNYSLVTVSSQECVKHFDNAFGYDRTKGKSCVKATGVARTDYFFDESNRRKAYKRLYSVCSQAKGKRVILYAPTYRGDADNAQPPEMFDISQLKSAVSGCVLLIKQHGFVKAKTPIPDKCRDFAFDVSDCMRIEDLLFVSDLVITDYSSLIFEYSLFEKPMVFYAYDLEEFYDYRGSYYKYDNDFLPGDIVTDGKLLAETVNRALNAACDRDRIHGFRERFMGACDGKSAKRIIDMVSDK